MASSAWDAELKLVGETHDDDSLTSLSAMLKSDQRILLVLIRHYG